MRPENTLSETLQFAFHGNAPTIVSVFARVHLGNLHLLYCAVTGLASRSISVKCDPRTFFQRPYSSRFTETLLLKLASSRRVQLGNLHLLYCAVTVLASRSISVKCDPRTLFQSPYSSRFTETLLL